MNVEVIVLNGGSSSGKSSLAACLQQRLDTTRSGSEECAITIADQLDDAHPEQLGVR